MAWKSRLGGDTVHVSLFRVLYWFAWPFPSDYRSDPESTGKAQQPGIGVAEVMSSHHDRFAWGQPSNQIRSVYVPHHTAVKRRVVYFLCLEPGTYDIMLYTRFLHYYILPVVYMYFHFVCWVLLLGVGCCVCLLYTSPSPRD